MAGGSGARFTWYGHSCIELVSPAGRTVLVDPWFANPRSTKAAADVDRCDLLLVTHGHFDHLDDDTLELARRLGPSWPCIHEMSLWAEPLVGASVRVIGMNKGGAVESAGLRVTMVHADHSAGGSIEGGARYLGEPVGFVVELEDARRVYFAGDTDVFGDMALIAELHHPDIAFLPIGGHYTMGPRQAAKAVELLRVSTVVPIHWGTFDLLTGRPDELRHALSDRGLANVRVVSPEPGEMVEL